MANDDTLNLGNKIATDLSATANKAAQDRAKGGATGDAARHADQNADAKVVQHAKPVSNGNSGHPFESIAALSAVKPSHLVIQGGVDVDSHGAPSSPSAKPSVGKGHDGR